jgi:ribosomal protein S18 acetylase RimI-like enzyme
MTVNYKIVPCEPKHAASLAVMWNESSKAWPFGFGGGVPFNEERMLDWLKETDSISTELAVRDDGRVLGYCEMTRYPKEPEAAYISLLNVHPDFHGCKIGKALLKKAVERAIQMQVRRLDLNTWPANMKAVPLYKKIGFFWVPETTVYMQNYVPLIAQQGPAKDFFARHDWYDTYERCLEVREDDEKWHGMKVFQYTWRAGNEYLRVVVDREAKAITAIENERWSVGSKISDASPVAGMDHQVCWMLENKAEQAVPVYLKASGDEAIKLNAEFQQQLDAKATIEFHSDLKIDAEVPQKEKNEPANRIKTIAVVGSEAFALETGARVRQPLTIDLYPEALPPFAAKGQKINAHIRLKNNLDRPISGRLQLIPGPGLSVECQAQVQDQAQGQTQAQAQVQAQTQDHNYHFSADAKHYAGIPITLSCDQPGVYQIDAIAFYDDNGTERSSRTQALTAVIVPLGGSVTGVTEKGGVLENEAICLKMQKQSGHLTIVDRLNGTLIGSQDIEAVGPPFWPNEFEALSATIEAQGSDALVARVASQQRPGLVFEKTIRLLSGSLIQITHRLYNKSKEPFTMQTEVVPSGMQRRRKLALPYKSGYIVEDIILGDFPHEDDLLRKAEEWQETWSAVEGDDNVFGVIWHPDSVAEAPVYSDVACLIVQFPEVKPGQVVESAPIYFYAGKGTIDSVRQQYSLLIKGCIAKDNELQPRRALEYGFDRPVLLNGDKADMKLHVSSMSVLKAIDGMLKVEMPEGWQCQPDTLAFEGVLATKPAATDAVVSVEAGAISSDGAKRGNAAAGVTGATGATPETGIGKATLTTAGGIRVSEFTCLRIGDGSAIKITECAGNVKNAAKNAVADNSKKFIVDNGLMRFIVDPAFCGSCHALEVGGINHLYSAYPEEGSFKATKPWFGGIHPIFYNERGGDVQLYRDEFSGEKAEWLGLGDQLWTGVRTRVLSKRQNFEGLVAETSYLTLGGSRIMAVVSKLTNLSQAPVRVEAGAIAYLQPGGDISKAMLHSEVNGHMYHRNRQAGYASVRAKWGAIENTENGWTILALSKQHDLYILDRTDGGAHLMLTTPFEVGAGETNVHVYYLVVLESFDQYKPYLSLL